MAQSKHRVTPNFGGPEPPLSRAAELQALELWSVGAPSSHTARLSLMREREHRSQAGVTCFGRDQDYPKHAPSVQTE